jgi:hypothetical protein
MGFVCGFTGGMLLTRVRDRLADPHWQRVAAGATAAILILAWIAAFGS